MFNEREMSKAIDWLFELFSPEDYEGYDEDEIGYAGGLCVNVNEKVSHTLMNF